MHKPKIIHSVPVAPDQSALSPGVKENETELWDQFRKGSESAFIIIYDRYFEKLFQYGNQLSGKPALTEDCIQDVFIQIRQKRAGLGDTNSIHFYLMKCLKRKLIREMKKDRNTTEFTYPDQFLITYSHEKTLIDRQIHEEQASLLNASLKQLSGRKKEALYYFYFEGLSYLQISDLMGLSHVKSARNLVYQAISSLKKASKGELK
ncbi:RNA polymerase sigma factor [Cyclobacterium roseum]|uniref:RNA polymerase sigma factor n=1 Tax=Cyclobacterium roseum TaxID=2666137 RepID=UPI001391EF2F|nr:sigma-70 family RNA polymerase sigma factor [Cyclobacterium roseum]